MKSMISLLAAKYLKPVLLLLSFIVLLRGHHHPGGGFIAALLGATGLVFEAIAGNEKETAGRMILDPNGLIALGMLFCLLAASVGFVEGQPVLSGQWTEWHIPLLGKISLGTPLLFDIGIYGVVTGSLLLSVLYILEETEWK